MTYRPKPIGSAGLTTMFKHEETGNHTSYPGQAHLGGSGPKGAECLSCQHFIRPRRTSSHGTCAQYAKIMGRTGPAFPYFASACRDWKGGAS
jgi:hypothetical protein